MLEFSLVLLASAIAGLIAWNAAQRASDADVANLQGDAIASLRQAAHTLVMTHYSAYQAGQPVARNGITLADGNSPGQSRKPTVANLQGMDLSVNNAQNTGFYKSLASANYDITIERSTICTTNPASPDCHVSGLICMTQPVRGYSSAAGEIDTFGIGVMLARLGGSGGASLLGSPAVITGADGTWSQANLFGTAGTVCARFGWGTEGDDYLRIADTRDPDFKGGQTVSGVIGGSVFTQIINGDAKVTRSLSIGAGTLAAACTPEGSMVWGTVGTVPSLLKCVAGVWTSTGLGISSAGAACTLNGTPAMTAAGTQLTCRDGVFRPVEDLMGRQGIYQMTAYGEGAVVPNPICGTGMTPRIIPIGVTAACSVGGGSATCTNDSGAFVGSVAAGNVVNIRGSNGASVAGSGAQLVVASVCSTF